MLYKKKKFRLNLPIISFCLSLLKPPVRPGLCFSQILRWVFDVGFFNSFFLESLALFIPKVVGS